MGKLASIFKAPKTPAPVVTPAPTSVADDAQATKDLQDERKRRAAASGATANIKSSLVNVVPDINTATKKSSLLGG